MRLNRIEIYVSDENDPIYYHWEVMHDFRANDEYDIMISRMEDEDNHPKKSTHFLGFSSSIKNPRIIFDRILEFRNNPNKYFFNITSLFPKADVVDDENVGGITITDASNDKIILCKF